MSSNMIPVSYFYTRSTIEKWVQYTIPPLPWTGGIEHTTWQLDQHVSYQEYFQHFVNINQTNMVQCDVAPQFLEPDNTRVLVETMIQYQNYVQMVNMQPTIMQVFPKQPLTPIQNIIETLCTHLNNAPLEYHEQVQNYVQMVPLTTMQVSIIEERTQNCVEESASSMPMSMLPSNMIFPEQPHFLPVQYPHGQFIAPIGGVPHYGLDAYNQAGEMNALDPHQMYIQDLVFTKAASIPNIEIQQPTYIPDDRIDTGVHYNYVSDNNQFLFTNNTVITEEMTAGVNINMENQPWPHGISLNDIARLFAIYDEPYDKRALFCNFCKDHGAPEELYISHKVKDVFGNITCPTLFNHYCEICGATGNSAHTPKYCPQRRSR